MQIKKIKGIVINETYYGESSKILHVLTQYGNIGILAKGCRNIKNKFRSVCQKFVYANFNVYYKKDGLSTLVDVELLNDLGNVKTDLKQIGYLTYLFDLAVQVMKEYEPLKVFEILEKAVLKINEGFDAMVITNIVELKYLAFLGVLPVLDRCAKCNRVEDIITISSDDGGYLCKNCYTNQYIVDAKTVKLLRMFYYVDISKIKELSVLMKNKMEINDFLENYYARYTGLYLKSKDFLNQIK